MPVKISSLEGNRQKLDGGAMFGNAPRPVWSQWIGPDEKGRIPLACRSLLIETDKHKILFEAGVGSFFEPKLADRFGIENPDRHILKESLSELGLKESDITHVILSHLHFDHAGGILPSYSEMQSPSWELLFPNAKYIVGREALERALKPHSRDRASFVPELNQKLTSSDRFFVVETNQKETLLTIKQCKIESFKKNAIPHGLPDELFFYFSDGHTPGQMLTGFKGANQNVFFCGDLIPGTPWVHLPITMGYDRYPEKLIDEKKQLYELLSMDKTLFFYTHDPVYCASKVKFNEGKKFEFVEPLKKLDHQLI